MPHTIIEDGDSLQIRATISDARELEELIAKLESRRSGWKAGIPHNLENDDVSYRKQMDE